MADQYSVLQDDERVVEEKIYEGFVSSSDEDRLIKFQTANWSERRELVSSFEDARLRQLGRRLIAFYATDLLSVEERYRFSKYICDKWSVTEQDVNWTTLEKVQIDLIKLKDSGVPRQEIVQLKRFYEARFQEHGCETHDWLLCA